MQFIIIAVIIVVLGLAYEFKNAGRCCGDCRYYSRCYKNKFVRNNLECPSCREFKER